MGIPGLRFLSLFQVPLLVFCSDSAITHDNDMPSFGCKVTISQLCLHVIPAQTLSLKYSQGKCKPSAARLSNLMT